MIHSIRHSLFLHLIATGLIWMFAASASAVTSYHIGNSLTNQSNPDAFELFAQNRGVELSTGYSVHGGWALNDFLSYPDDPDILTNEYGLYTTALANNHWDIVTLQPHRSFPGTQMHQDVSSILSLINTTRSNPANADTNFYIFQTWPDRTFNYQQEWTAPLLDHPATPNTRSRAYFNYLIERVRAETDANVYMIPAGEVLYELDKRFRSREIPGISSVYNLYGDDIHMAPGAGRYITGLTMYATMMGQYPNELPPPSGFYEGNIELTPLQESLVQEVIRQVIDSSPYSGLDLPLRPVSDFNLDGMVDERDLVVFNNAVGITDPYDLDEDGDVDGRDFLAWQRRNRQELNTLEAAEFAFMDLNGNGYVEPGDAQAWQDAFSLNGDVDLDGDGDSDGRDFLIWQRSTTLWPGDLNRDFLIDGVELQAWKDTFGFTVAADANGDGIVTMADYAIWESENGRIWTFPFAQTSPLNPGGISAVNAVPEPGTLVLSAIAILSAASTRRRSR